VVPQLAVAIFLLAEAEQALRRSLGKAADPGLRSPCLDQLGLALMDSPAPPSTA
jgi:hypothetical protein